jgi:3-phenylpropionate/trans-cinnamate dioxygenase ferredoxin reductase component
LRSTALPRLRVLDEEMARVFAELHTAHGVDLRMGAGVSEIHGDGARVSSVTLSDGDTVPADAVVAGVGIRPASDSPRRVLKKSIRGCVAALPTPHAVG